MRPLIPPLHSGPWGSILSASPRLLTTFKASKCHLSIASTQPRISRSSPARFVPPQVGFRLSARILKPSPDLSALNSITRYTWIGRQQSFTTSQILRSNRETHISKPFSQNQEPLPAEVGVEGFERSEKASRAAQVNLSARLNKDGSPNPTKPGTGEIVRLLKIARPEARWLGGTNSEDQNLG